jgi:DNA-binding NtrC family response regulator
MVGEHPLMKRVVSQIERFGPTLKPVLVLGETGTGKELVARALHECSLNRPGLFEPLNCGAIPRDLAESELFGHTEGAFTGACRPRKGAFERADGGTLFLDEVGEMPRELQPKLLRALEEEAIHRIGEERRRRVKVRLISATHRDLLRDADQERFRLDLYHRLAVAVIHLPPLRERREDIPLLVEHFMRKEQPPGAEIVIAPDGMRFLMDQPWRGNVRSLLHLVEVAATLDKSRIGPADLRGILCDTESSTAVTDGFVRYRGRPFEAVRREIYRNVLREQEGNHTAAANALGIPKSTFFDQIRTMQIGYRADPGG